MTLKSVQTAIGNFNSIYSNAGLMALEFIGQKSSNYPADLNLQKLMDIFFTNSKAIHLPPLDLQGSNFQLKVWKALSNIPSGKTESYKSLAEKVGSPNAARAVGTACKYNPIPLLIPCHRAVKQDGSIGEFALGSHNKKFLLELEQE